MTGVVVFLHALVRHVELRHGCLTMRFAPQVTDTVWHASPDRVWRAAWVINAVLLVMGGGAAFVRYLGHEDYLYVLLWFAFDPPHGIPTLAMAAMLVLGGAWASGIGRMVRQHGTCGWVWRALAVMLVCMAINTVVGLYSSLLWQVQGAGLVVGLGAWWNHVFWYADAVLFGLSWVALRPMPVWLRRRLLLSLALGLISGHDVLRPVLDALPWDTFLHGNVAALRADMADSVMALMRMAAIAIMLHALAGYLARWQAGFHIGRACVYDSTA